MKKLGELLVEREWLTREQLTQALRHQQVFGGRLGTCLLELSLLTEDRLMRALSDQLGTPPAGADDLRVIGEGVLELIPAKLACRVRAVPFERYGNSVSVAMMDTRDLLLQDELAFVTSKRLKVHVAPEVRILEALEKHYGCNVEARFSRIWDRLNRVRYLWQEETGGGGKAAARRDGGESPPPPPVGPAGAAAWQPTPPPPLDSGIHRVAAAPAAPPARPAPAPAAPAWASAPAATAAPGLLAPAPPPTLPPPVAAPVAPPVRPRPEAQPTPVPPRAAAPVAPPNVAPPPAAPHVQPAPAPAPPPTAAAAGRETLPAAPTPTPIAQGGVAGARDLTTTDTTPLVLPPPVESLADLERRIGEVEERDDVAHAALSFLERRFRRRLLFMVRGGEVAAWMGTGEGVDQRLFGDLEIGFDEPSLFLNLREGSPFYRGPLPRLEAHQRLARIWGGRLPKECVLLPVRIKGRLVAIVYVDRAGEEMADVDLGELQQVGAVMGRGFESFLMKRKQGG